MLQHALAALQSVASFDSHSTQRMCHIDRGGSQRELLPGRRQALVLKKHDPEVLMDINLC